MISIIAPGKSLNKTIPIFKQRLIGFLNRHGYSALIDKFGIDNNIVIYTTKSRSMLGFLTQVKLNSEYHCMETPENYEINYDYLEDLYLDFPLKDMKDKKNYIWAYRYMDNLINKNENY
ncbi:MAG TPA: hypothetical protein VKA34_05970 [Balneolales bacterium]|nr:hypothetical protein [Balneolales bacterium]